MIVEKTHLRNIPKPWFKIPNVRFKQVRLKILRDLRKKGCEWAIPSSRLDSSIFIFDKGIASKLRLQYDIKIATSSNSCEVAYYRRNDKND